MRIVRKCEGFSFPLDVHENYVIIHIEITKFSHSILKQIIIESDKIKSICHETGKKLYAICPNEKVDRLAKIVGFTSVGFGKSDVGETIEILELK